MTALVILTLVLGLTLSNAAKLNGEIPSDSGSIMPEDFRQNMITNLIMSNLKENAPRTRFNSKPAHHSDITYPGRYDYDLPEDFQPMEAFKRDYNPKDFIKKSFTDNKRIRFHQCYFNPISCFKR